MRASLMFRPLTAAARIALRASRCFSRIGLVLGLIARHRIECAARRSGILTAAHSLKSLADLKRRVEIWNARGAPLRLLSRDEMEAASGTGFYAGGCLDPRGGAINPLGYARGLARAVIGKGGAIRQKAEVRSIKRTGSQWRVATERGGVDADSVIVLQNAGPQGAPGMPEWGQLPIPQKLLKQGVRDMVRISDARMSGTSYGACVLHVTPEAFVGGPLALVRDGDRIELDVPNRKLQLLVDDAELARRRAEWKPPKPHFTRGFGTLYLKHVTQADKGCDFDFLEGGATLGTPPFRARASSTESFVSQRD